MVVCGLPLGTVYGVSLEEVVRFVESDVLVENFLSKYEVAPRGLWFSGSRLERARVLCRFFKWLRVKRRIVLSPSELLEKHKLLRLSPGSSFEDRQWLLSLVLEHSRDNPDFEDNSDSRKYALFSILRSFCDFYEVPLTTAKRVYGKRKRKKVHRKQITVADAKSFLGKICQRDRAILLIMFQSGMSIGEVLNKLNYMWHSQVEPQLAEGCSRLKVEFDDRKANGRWYFTYVGRDGIHELKKWLVERKKLVERVLRQGAELSETIIRGEPIFLTQYGTPLTEQCFVKNMWKKRKGKVTSHMFRKLFKTEASIPERGVDQRFVEFWMGHGNGVDAVGGEYDRSPEVYENVFEGEYAKLEEYVNIYSGKRAIDDPLLAKIERLTRNNELARAFFDRVFHEFRQFEGEHDEQSNDFFPVQPSKRNSKT